MDGENFILSVTDNGTGFPEDVLQRVNGIKNKNETEADTDSTNGQSSHGLGLTIVRQIIKTHNGSTRFSNLAGGGCRAICYLPSITS